MAQHIIKVIFRWMDGKNNSLEKPNITDTSETLPDGKRMTVSSILRYKFYIKGCHPLITSHTSGDGW